MDRQIIAIVAVFVIGVIFFAGASEFGVPEPAINRDLPSLFPLLPSPVKPLTKEDAGVVADFVWPKAYFVEPTAEAWAVFQNYLGFAKAHDLPGLRNLSHQISATCLDPSKETECFALMDSVYSFGIPLVEGDFKHLYHDERQLVMHTDGPVVTILYFTRDEGGFIKMLGMRFCFEGEAADEKCVEADSIREDTDNDGWWNSVESLFY